MYRVMWKSHQATPTSARGFLAHRELDDALGLTASVGELLVDARTGKNPSRIHPRLLVAMPSEH